MSSDWDQLAQKLAPLIAKEVIRELEEKASFFGSKVAPTLTVKDKTSFKSEEELEEWASKEAESILASMRKKRRKSHEHS